MFDIDDKMINNLLIIQKAVEIYKEKKGSYAGFSFDLVRANGFYASVDESGCSSKIQLAISPDGTKYIAYFPTCMDEKKSSLCIENGAEKGMTADTLIAQKEYHCSPYQDPTIRFGDLDKKMFANAMIAWDEIERYKKAHGSYQGFDVSNTNNKGSFSLKLNDADCSNEIKIDIAKDGKSYRITYNFCLNNKMLCMSNNSQQQPAIVEKKVFSSVTEKCSF